MSQSLSHFIYKGAHSQCLLFTMQKDDFLKPHRALVDVMIIAKKGTIKVNDEQAETVLEEGGYLVLDANIKHAVTALSDAEFYLIKLAPANG